MSHLERRAMEFLVRYALHRLQTEFTQYGEVLTLQAEAKDIIKQFSRAQPPSSE